MHCPIVKIIRPSIKMTARYVHFANTSMFLVLIIILRIFVFITYTQD